MARINIFKEIDRVANRNLNLVDRYRSANNINISLSVGYDVSQKNGEIIVQVRRRLLNSIHFWIGVRLLRSNEIQNSDPCQYATAIIILLKAIEKVGDKNTIIGLKNVRLEIKKSQKVRSEVAKLINIILSANHSIGQNQKPIPVTEIIDSAASNKEFLLNVRARTLKTYLRDHLISSIFWYSSIYGNLTWLCVDDFIDVDRQIKILKCMDDSEEVDRCVGIIYESYIRLQSISDGLRKKKLDYIDFSKKSIRPIDIIDPLPLHLRSLIGTRLS